MMHRWRMVYVAAGVVAMAAVVGCAASKKQAVAPVITHGRVNVGAASDFPAGTVNGRFLLKYGIMVSNASGDPVAIRTTYGPELVAVWEPEHHEFVCKKDGSRFDMIGRVLEGPAKKPLPALLAERQADGTLVVDLTKLYGM